MAIRLRSPNALFFGLVALSFMASGCPGPAPEDADVPSLDAGRDAASIDGGGADGGGLDGGGLDGGLDAPVPDASSSGTIGPSGGMVSAGDAEVTIPSGALSTDVAIAVGAVSAPLPLPPGYEAVSLYWAFTPHGTAFAAPVSVRIAHDGGADVVFRLDGPVDTAWDVVSGATISASDASFTSTGFSFYVVARIVAAPGGVVPLYPAAGGWNDFVVNDGTDRFSSSGTSCTPAISMASGLHTACLHGGEMRAVTVPGRSSCAGLTATDGLNAFDWECVVRGGMATFVSWRLKEDVRLANLIDFDGLGWRENALTVFDGASTVHVSPSERWWTNPIVRDDDGGLLDAPGTIYVVRTDSLGDYMIAADRVALVIEPGHRLAGGPATTSQLRTNSIAPRFGVWIEGDANARAASNWSFRLLESVIRHVSITDAGGVGAIEFGGIASRLEHVRIVGDGTGTGIGLHIGTSSFAAEGSLVRDVRIARCGDALTLLPGATRNVVEDVIVSSSRADGIGVRGSGNVLANITSVHNRRGIVLYGSSLLMHATVAHGDVGVMMPFSGGQMLVGVNSFENLYSGIELGSAGPQFLHDVASWANMQISFRFTVPRPAGGYGHVFSGRFGTGQTYDSPPTRWWVDETACNSSRSGTSSTGDCNGSRATVATAGADGLRSLTVAPFTCAIDTNSTATSLFLGGSGGFFPTRVPPFDEPTNTSDTNGVAAFADVDDWFGFDGPYRAWGAEGSATPNCFATGACSDTSMGSAGCQIWDYTLRAGADEFVLGASLARPTGDETLSVDFPIGLIDHIASEASCLAAFSGAVIVPPAGARTYAICRVTFLDHAREVLGDLSGNENLLCESGETCLFTPNIASYQGHGAIVPSPGPFVDGAITGVTLVEYETNGVAAPWRP
jgi:hypothetical protein